MAIGFECFVCHIVVSAAGRSLVQRSPTEYVCVVMIRHNRSKKRNFEHSHMRDFRIPPGYQ